MADEQDLTPEEKLLEVIQKGDTPAKGRASDALGSDMIGDGNDAVADTKHRGMNESPVSLKAINRILVVLALVAIGFSAYEIYGNMPKEDVTFASSNLDLNIANQSNLVATADDTLDMFHSTRITGIPPNPRPTLDDRMGPVLDGWRAYAHDNLKFLAISKFEKKKLDGTKETVVEAIVMDTKAKKMLFLQVGQYITLSDMKVRVDKIGDKTVEFVCEDDRQIIGDTEKK